MSLPNKHVITTFEFDNTDWLIEKIQRKASKDQSKTSIRLNRAYCGVYQPWRVGRNDFEPLRLALVPKVREVLGEEDLWISRDIWGLNYLNGEGTAPHCHQGARYSAIWYLRADEGCGTLEFSNPDMEIVPENNMLILFDADWYHGVLPNTVKDAQRTCIAMNIHRVTELSHFNDERGFYTPDVSL